MLAIQTIKEHEVNTKWQKLIGILHARIQEITKEDNNKKSHSLYEDILLDLTKIEHIEKMLLSQKEELEIASDIKKKLILERDESRIEASFKFLVHLVNQEEIEFKQRIDNFSIGINSINATLLYSGNTIYSIKKIKIEQFIRNLYVFMDVWKSFSHRIEDNSIFLIHKNSLNLIYASLYILEYTYSQIQNKTEAQKNLDSQLDWKQERKNRDDLFEAIEEWSEEEWSEEEQKAYERAMANL